MSSLAPLYRISVLPRNNFVILGWSVKITYGRKIIFFDIFEIGYFRIRVKPARLDVGRNSRLLKNMIASLITQEKPLMISINKRQVAHQNTKKTFHQQH